MKLRKKKNTAPEVESPISESIPVVGTALAEENIVAPASATVTPVEVVDGANAVPGEGTDTPAVEVLPRRPLGRRLKKPLMITAVVLGSVGLLWGGLTMLRSARRQAVSVYAVTDFYATDEWGNASESSGMVTTDKIQKIYLSSTQSVTQICVTEGQEVHKGDKLLEYDTTLSQLDLTRSEIELERSQLAIDQLQKQLEALQEHKTQEQLEKRRSLLENELSVVQSIYRGLFSKDHSPSVPVSSVSENITKEYGTSEYPVYVVDSDFTYEKLQEEQQLCIAKGTVTAEDDFYVVVYSPDAEAGDVAIQGVILQSDGVMSFFTPSDIPAGDDISKYSITAYLIRKKIADIEELMADPLTPADDKDAALQLKQLRQQIDEAQVTLKLATLSHEQKVRELQDGAVYAKIDGVVKAVRSETEAFQNSQPVVEVSGGGGYYITGAVSELDLNSVHIGDTVQISSWMTGTFAEGEIVSVENYPTTDQNAWSGGNQNVSYYPIRVFVSEDADLQENDYVSITYQSSGGRDIWYLDNMFIRTENGKSYVFVQGEDGRLEKRDITIGGSLWGSYTEICSGLTTDDYVAFPYGKDVVDGAKTEIGSIETLYGW